MGFGKEGPSFKSLSNYFVTLSKPLTFIYKTRQLHVFSRGYFEGKMKHTVINYYIMSDMIPTPWLLKEETKQEILSPSSEYISADYGRPKQTVLYSRSPMTNQFFKRWKKYLNWEKRRPHGGVFKSWGTIQGKQCELWVLGKLYYFSLHIF